LRERLDAVLRHEDLQLGARVNAPRLCASFNERGFGVLVPAEKKVFAQPLVTHAAFLQSREPVACCAFAVALTLSRSLFWLFG
jgi:hypothetical protein